MFYKYYIFMTILINKQNNGKFKLKKKFLLQSGIIPLSFLPTSGLFCKDATHMMNYISVLSDSSIKDLGITFQDTLTFDEHISKFTSTENRKLGIIRNTFHVIDREGFKFFISVM